MKLIAGLGNPGKKYENSRHNVGFRIIEKLAYRHNAKLKKNLFKKCRQANLSVSGEDIILIQPLTFMNLSGTNILYFYKKLNLFLKDILIICDDINLPLGKVRIRPSGSSGGHNGLESVIGSLKSEGFPRLRIGIKTEENIEDLSEYVLSEFKDNEERIIENTIDDAVNTCETWIKDGTEITMSKFN